MPRKKSDYSHTEIKDADGNLKEIVFMPSTVETIDQAIFNYIDEGLDLHSNTNKGWKKTPVIWVATERSHQIKNSRDFRNNEGVFKLPLITVERTSMTKDPSFRGTFQAHMPDFGKGYHKVRRVNVPAARRINQSKTSNFKNAWSARQRGNINNTNVGHGQQNFPSSKTSKSRVVYETIYQPIPIWVQTMYSIKIRAEYVQQMNDLISPFATLGSSINYFVIDRNGHRYEVFLNESISQQNNISNIGVDERIYKTDINFEVLGYIIGENPNGDRPKVIKRENAVEVKVGREQVIFGDIPEYGDGKSFFVE